MIRQAEVQHRHGLYGVLPSALSLTPLPAPPMIAFSSSVTSASWLARQTEDQRFVQRFDKAHVDQRGVQRFSRFRASGSSVPKFRIATFSPRRFTRPLPIGSFSSGSSATPMPHAARVAHGARAILIVVAGKQHLAALVLVAWRHDHHVRDAAQVGDRSNAPWCVWPSAPTMPARSMANSTGRFWIATSWIT